MASENGLANFSSIRTTRLSGWDLRASEAALLGVKSNNNMKYLEIYKS
jgi:hypothetical protein